MPRTYILKEPQHVREDVATTVALLRYMRVFSREEINPLTAEIAARYDRILEKSILAFRSLKLSNSTRSRGK